VGRSAPAGVDFILQAHRNEPMLPQASTVELLRAYGFRCASYQSVCSLDEATAAANKLAYPIILKGMIANMAHRSDAGLVSGKISNDGELYTHFTALENRMRSFGQEDIQINVESFVPHDQEVILGVKYDTTFGPVILCGLGGIFTEILKDYALRLAPLTMSEAEDMLSSLKAFPVLRQAAAKGMPHIASLTAALLRLSDLAVELRGKISSVDINPVGLSSDSSQLTVLDAKIHLDEKFGGFQNENAY
jgi:acetyltransferase